MVHLFKTIVFTATHLIDSSHSKNIIFLLAPVVDKENKKICIGCLTLWKIHDLLDFKN